MTLYKVKLDKFEGPLDLLLDLIEKEKMDITQVSLSKVTDDYLRYLENSEDINPNLLADFLQVAAQLILLKSRNLLPELCLDNKEELSADDLQARLLEYKMFKDLSVQVGGLYGNNICFEQKFCLNKNQAFYPGRNLNLKSLAWALTGLLGRFEKLEKLEERTIKETISIKEKISFIKDLISKQVCLKFNDLVVDKKSKLEKIISFLAVLELSKQHYLNVSQKNVFGDIIIDGEIRKLRN